MKKEICAVCKKPMGNSLNKKDGIAIHKHCMKEKELKKELHDCAGCTDSHSEGTHAMHTKQHPCKEGGDPDCGYCFPEDFKRNKEKLTSSPNKQWIERLHEVLKQCYNDNEAGGSSRWLLAPNTVEIMLIGVIEEVTSEAYDLGKNMKGSSFREGYLTGRQEALEEAIKKVKRMKLNGHELHNNCVDSLGGPKCTPQPVEEYNLALNDVLSTLSPNKEHNETN